MQILKKGIAPDGTHIQIEDWSEDYASFPYGATLAAYPKKYMRIRAEIDCKSYGNALIAFEKLESGSATVLDMDFTIMRNATRIPLKPILESVMKKY